MLVPKGMAWLGVYVDPVNSMLEELNPPGGKTPLESAVAAALRVGGKRVRATLALLWCEVYSGEYLPAVPLAAAYELAHASALIQDDVIDKSSMRRGSPSVEARYGLTTALLASDLLLFNVPKMIARYSALDSERLARVFDLVGEACRATTWGEFIDMELSESEWDLRRYEEMIRMKTSSLLSAPSASGALVGGASEIEASVASRFGEEVGLAYQIQDDMLDLLGEERDLGKPVFTDLRGGKKSLALMHCVDRCSSDEKRFVSSLFHRSGPYEAAEVSRLRDLLKDHGSLDYANSQVRLHTDAAKAAITSVPDGVAKTRLGELAEYLATRYY